MLNAATRLRVVSTPVDRALELSAVWDVKLRADLPECEIFDVHTHIGDDIDGMRGRPDELLGSWTCTASPRHSRSAWTSPTVIRRSPHRTTARSRGPRRPAAGWSRSSASTSPRAIEEAERCFDRGARGIKLHPRAQGFLLTDERLEPVFALAAERRVPILIHGGRGLPPSRPVSRGSSTGTQRPS